MDIVPLSPETLDAAIALTIKVFDSQEGEFDYPGKWMPASLLPSGEKRDEIFASYNCTFCQYFVAVEEGEVIGTTGLYSLAEDEVDSDWVAWFCLDSNYRGRGYGSQLLDYVISLAQGRGKRFLRVYASAGEEKDPALSLYTNRGFREFKQGMHEDTGEELVYLQLPLQ